MNVQLLGCVELRTAVGDRVSMSPAVGLLLAALVWSPNAFVADEDVIDRVWDETRPAHPRNALYTLATRLRKALQSVGTTGVDCDVIRRRGGYVLAIDEEVVDAFRFRLLVRHARSAASRGEDEHALSFYDEALSLWHGDPLSGMQTTWADAARVTLRHERRTAMLKSAEIGLRLERHDEYVPHLYQLAGAHPLDERVTGLLMLALYRSGRQDEAQRCFRLIRSRLLDELGDEPGHDLRALHEQILRRDEKIRSDYSPQDALAS
jgi:DNA-binding SARP family transcriptional activator